MPDRDFDAEKLNQNLRILYGDAQNKANEVLLGVQRVMGREVALSNLRKKLEIFDEVFAGADKELLLSVLAEAVESYRTTEDLGDRKHVLVEISAISLLLLDRESAEE